MALTQKDIDTLNFLYNATIAQGASVANQKIQQMAALGSKRTELQTAYMQKLQGWIAAQKKVIAAKPAPTKVIAPLLNTSAPAVKSPTPAPIPAAKPAPDMAQKIKALQYFSGIVRNQVLKGQVNKAQAVANLQANIAKETNAQYKQAMQDELVKLQNTKEPAKVATVAPAPITKEPIKEEPVTNVPAPTHEPASAIPEITATEHTTADEDHMYDEPVTSFDDLWSQYITPSAPATSTPITPAQTQPSVLSPSSADILSTPSVPVNIPQQQTTVEQPKSKGWLVPVLAIGASLLFGG